MKNEVSKFQFNNEYIFYSRSSRGNFWLDRLSQVRLYSL